jgi:hypothetical protein
VHISLPEDDWRDKGKSRVLLCITLKNCISYTMTWKHYLFDGEWWRMGELVSAAVYREEAIIFWPGKHFEILVWFVALGHSIDGLLWFLLTPSQTVIGDCRMTEYSGSFSSVLFHCTFLSSIMSCALGLLCSSSILFFYFFWQKFGSIWDILVVVYLLNSSALSMISALNFFF